MAPAAAVAAIAAVIVSIPLSWNRSSQRGGALLFAVYHRIESAFVAVEG